MKSIRKVGNDEIHSRLQDKLAIEIILPFSSNLTLYDKLINKGIRFKKEISKEWAVLEKSNLP